MLPHEHEHVAGERKQVEEQQRAPLSPLICDPSTRISIDGSEQRLECIKEPDDEDGRAKRFEILWRKTEPKLFTQRSEDERHQEQQFVCAAPGSPQPAATHSLPRGDSPLALGVER